MIDSDLPTAEELLEVVHSRLGCGIKLKTDPDGLIEVSWQRDDDGRLSDVRHITGDTLCEVLQAILDYEDEIDECDDLLDE